jgi:hypothetical protein
MQTPMWLNRLFVKVRVVQFVEESPGLFCNDERHLFPRRLRTEPFQAFPPFLHLIISCLRPNTQALSACPAQLEFLT